MVEGYTHLGAEWPEYRWDASAFAAELADVHRRRGALMMAMATLGFDARREAVLGVIVEDVTRSSEIEGESLNEAQVRSSVARRLGMDHAGLPEPARDVEGVVEMTLDATQRFDAPLNEERIFAWHAALFPTGRSGMSRIVTGAYRDDRDGPMRVVSGPVGRERVHFEAPAAGRLPGEMARFLAWFERQRMDPVVKAAVAHLWFVTIHPMEDGNGRIGRAILDMALARADGDRQRFYSMTAQIHAERKAYYAELERASRGSMDVTLWIVWCLGRLSAALDSAEGVLGIVRRKRAFWDVHRDDGLNERQTKVVNLLFDGLDGRLQTALYARIARCSNDTALRDLTDLVGRGVLVRDAGGGRSTGYTLVPGSGASAT